MRSRTIRERLKHLFFAAGTVLLLLGGALAVAEVVVRAFVPAERWIFLDASADWAVDARLGWTNQANRDVTSLTNHGWSVHFRTNRDGLTPADARREKRPGVLRVMFVGDSIVLGRSVPQDEAVSAQLERILRGRGLDVEVLNAAVEGYSTDQALLRMEQLLPLYEPDVVLLGVCANDFGGNASSVAYRQHKPRFELDDAGELHEIPAAPQARVERRGRGPSAWIQRSAVYRLLQPGLFALRAKLGGWNERNLLGLADDYYYRPEELERIDWKLFAALIRRMNESAARAGTAFGVYAHPALPEVWQPYIDDTIRNLGLEPGEYDPHALERRVQQAVSASGAAFCPLIDTFRAQQARGPFHLLPWDPHCNPEGYAVTAERLADFVVRLTGREPAAVARAPSGASSLAPSKAMGRR